MWCDDCHDFQDSLNKLEKSTFSWNKCKQIFKGSYFFKEKSAISLRNCAMISTKVVFANVFYEIQWEILMRTSHKQNFLGIFIKEIFQKQTLKMENCGENSILIKLLLLPSFLHKKMISIKRKACVEMKVNKKVKQNWTKRKFFLWGFSSERR